MIFGSKHFKRAFSQIAFYLVTLCYVVQRGFRGTKGRLGGVFLQRANRWHHLPAAALKRRLLNRQVPFPRSLHCRLGWVNSCPIRGRICPPVSSLSVAPGILGVFFRGREGWGTHRVEPAYSSFSPVMVIVARQKRGERPPRVHSPPIFPLPSSFRAAPNL